MVSFDVVSLFTTIPTALALQVTKNRLEAGPTISEGTNMSVDSIMILLEFVLDNNYFIADGTFYKQIFGCPMGSPVSTILANLVTEHVKERALISAPHPPKWQHSKLRPFWSPWRVEKIFANQNSGESRVMTTILQLKVAERQLLKK